MTSALYVVTVPTKHSKLITLPVTGVSRRMRSRSTRREYAISKGGEHLNEETRVRLGVKQTAKGAIQLDITAEAPTVDEAGILLGKAIVRLIKEVKDQGLKTVDEVT